MDLRFKILIFLKVHWRSYAGQGGQKVPMFAVRYTDGTPCDILSNIPRETTVYYGIFFRNCKIE